MPLFIVLLVLVLVVAVATPTIAYYIRSAGKVESEYNPAQPSDPSFKQPKPSFRLSSSDETEIKNLYISVPDQGYPVFVRVAIVITWQKLADCICLIPQECSGEKCSNCADCNDCEDCEDCVDCPKCEEVYCDSCGQEDKQCECEDCEECPRCNDDPDDDWDVIFAIPQKGEDYSLTLGDKWTTVENNEFYYCTSAVQSLYPDYDKLEPLSTPVFITECKLLSTAQPPIEGCVLNVEIIVQTIQAIGYTDPDKNGNETPAWQDAWGLTKNPFN